MANNKETLHPEESIENQKQVKNDFDYQGPIKSFIEDKIQGNLEYFRNISLENKWNDFIAFLTASNSSYDHTIINNFENNKKSYLQKLNYFINYEVFPIYDLIKNLEKLFNGEYNLDNSQKQKLHKEITSSSQSELSHIYYSQIKRKNFLINKLGIKKEDLENTTQGITKDEEQKLNEIFSDANIVNKIKDNKKLQLAIFSIYNMNSTLYIEDLKYVLDLLDKNSKIEFVKFFIPSISLSKALSAGIITKNQVSNVVRDRVVEYNNALTEEEIQKIIKDVELDRLYIDTDKLDFTHFDLENSSDQLLQIMVDEFNESKKGNTEILGQKDFENRCKESGLNIGIENFQEGKYITITSTNADGITTPYYFYIEKITSTGVELKNVTKRNGITSPDNKDIKLSTFNELFELLENASKDQSKKVFIHDKTYKKFINDQEVPETTLGDNVVTKTYIGNNEIQEIPDNNEVNTIEKLHKALDELDPKGSEILIDQMAFRFKKGAKDAGPFDENFYYVVASGPDFIKLDNGQRFEGAELASFVDAFEENKCSRFKKLSTADEFLNEMQGLGDSFKDIVFDDGKFVPKDQKGHHDNPGINLFVGNDKDKDGSIQIDAVENGYISFTAGEYIEGNKQKNEPNIFKGDKSAKNWSYTEFFMFVKNKKLEKKEEPHEEHHDEHHKGEHMHQHRSLFTAWMSNFYSITEIVKGAHQLLHAVEHSFETGNKLKAAKAALFMGKLLPHHLYVELQSEVESSEKETMEKIKKELTGVDSKVMFPMIVHILENSSAPQYEVEAAMFATLKYGSLYPKDLAKYRGQYVWFEKLGGHKSMIPQLTQDMLKDDPKLVITEEVLINALLAQQAMGIVNPKRRSKIHKEFGATIQEGLNKEAGDGERETGLRMTPDGRISYIMGEFKGSTFANGIGGMENVWAKGPDPAWKMNTIPFVIMASGLSLDLHQSLINKLKKFGYTTPYNSLSLAASKTGVEMYQKYIDKVIELYSGGKTSEMYLAYQKAKKGSDSGKIALSMKDFWDTYGGKLYPVINMNDGYVISKKDEEGNEILNEYYEHIYELHNSNDFSAKTEHIEEGFYDANNSPFAQSGALLYKIVPKDRGYLDSVGKTVLNAHMDYIQKVLDNSEIKSDEEKRNIFVEGYKKLERHVYNKMVAYKPQGDIKNWYGQFEIYMEMRKKGFDVYDVQLKDPNDPIAVKNFDKGYEEFLEKEWIKFKNKSHVPDDEIFTQKSLIQHNINDILTGIAANDDQIKQMA